MASRGGHERRARDRLLTEVIDYFAANGTSDVSLRTLASAIGTSHRMLIYHFGSKEGLLVEVVRAMEATQRATLTRLIESRADEGLERDFWRQVSDRRLHPFTRLFFEVYGQALQHRSWAEPLLDGVVDDWVSPIASHLVARGVAEDDALAEARLGVAVARGLLLDLLATRNRRAVDAAAERFFTRHELIGTNRHAEKGMRHGARARR